MAERQDQIQETQVPLPVTTISTIAIQAGEAKIVLAILRSTQWVRVRVQEMTPIMVEVGHNLQEALRLRQQHQDLLQQLTAKQQQINSLLTQADTLIASQQAYNEVYEAMAESLGEAWKDLNAQLEDRRTLLDQSVTFHQSAQEFSERMDAALEEFNTVAVAQDVPTAKSLLQKHLDLKKSILEASMHTLNKGQALLDRIKEVGNQMDPRFQHATTAACYGIERVMEELHDRRRLLEELWLRRKLKLEQCLLLCELSIEVEDISDWFKTRGEDYMKRTDIGDSLEATEKLIKEHFKFEESAREIQINVQRLLRAADKVVSTGAEDTEQVQEQTKVIETLCETFIHKLELRRKLLQMTAAFYRNASTALSHLNQFEVQLQTKDVPEDSPELVEKHSRLEQAIYETSAPVLREGHLLLERVGRDVSGGRGVNEMLATLEAKATQLQESCTAHKEAEAKAKSSLYVQFEERYSVLLMWMVNVGEAFLSSHRDLGTHISNVTDFLEEHEQLEEDIRDKDEEVEAVLQSVSELVKSGDQETQTVQGKVQQLKIQWKRLTVTVETRIKIALTLVEFHRVAKQLSNAMDNMDDIFKSIESLDLQNIPEATVTHWSQKWTEITELYTLFETKANTFLSEAKLIREDPNLNIQGAISQVEAMLKDYRDRKTTLSDRFDSWQIRITAFRDFKIQWEQFIKDSRKTIEWIMNTEAEFFPQIAGELGNSLEEAIDRQNKLSQFEKTVQKMNEEIEERVKTAEMLALKGNTHGEKDLIVNELVKVHQRFQVRLNEYQLLLTMTISFYESLAKLTTCMERAEIEYRRTDLPTHRSEVQIMLQQHDRNKEELSDLFRTTINIGAEIVTRVRQYDPLLAAQQGVETVLQQTQMRKQQWLEEARTFRLRLQQQTQFSQYDQDKQKLLVSLQTAKKDLEGLHGKYGDSVHTVTLLVEKFDEWLITIRPVKEAYENFISTAKIMLGDKHYASDEIKKDVEDAEKFWNELTFQIEDHSKKLRISVEYHELLEQVGPEKSYAIIRERYLGHLGGAPLLAQSVPREILQPEQMLWESEEYPKKEQQPIEKIQEPREVGIERIFQEPKTQDYVVQEPYAVHRQPYPNIPSEWEVYRESPSEQAKEWPLAPPTRVAHSGFVQSVFPQQTQIPAYQPEMLSPKQESLESHIDKVNLTRPPTVPVDWPTQARELPMETAQSVYAPEPLPREPEVQLLQPEVIPPEYHTEKSVSMSKPPSTPLNWEDDIPQQPGMQPVAKAVSPVFVPAEPLPREPETQPLPSEVIPPEYHTEKSVSISKPPTTPVDLDWNIFNDKPKEVVKKSPLDYLDEELMKIAPEPSYPLKDFPPQESPIQPKPSYLMEEAPLLMRPTERDTPVQRPMFAPQTLEPQEYRVKETVTIPISPTIEVKRNIPRESPVKPQPPTYLMEEAPVLKRPRERDAPRQKPMFAPLTLEPQGLRVKETVTIPISPVEIKRDIPRESPVKPQPPTYLMEEAPVQTRPTERDAPSQKLMFVPLTLEPQGHRVKETVTIPISPVEIKRDIPRTIQRMVPQEPIQPKQWSEDKPTVPVYPAVQRKEDVPHYQPREMEPEDRQEYSVEETVTIPIQPLVYSADIPKYPVQEPEEPIEPSEYSVESTVTIPIKPTINLDVPVSPRSTPRGTPRDSPVIFTDEESVTEVTEITRIHRHEPDVEQRQIVRVKNKPISRVSYYQAPPIQKAIRVVKPQVKQPRYRISNYIVEKHLYLDRPRERCFNQIYIYIEEYPLIVLKLLRLPNEPHYLAVLEQFSMPMLANVNFTHELAPESMTPTPSPTTPQASRPQVSIAPQAIVPPSSHISPHPESPSKQPPFQSSPVTVVSQPDGSIMTNTTNVKKHQTAGAVYEQYYSVQTMQKEDGNTIIGQKRMYLGQKAQFFESN